MFHMSRYRWVCTIVVVLTLSFALSLYFSPDSSVEAQSNSQQQVYVPSVMLDTVTDAVSQSGQERRSDEWLTYESKSGGYSFMYPSTYTVTEYEQGFVQLHLVGEDPANASLTLMYLQYEISPTERLLDWAKLYDTYNKEEGFEVDFSPSNLDGSKFGPGSRQLYVESTKTSPLPLQAFLITNDRLVLRVSAHTPADSKSPPLQDIAQTVRFSDKAPQDLAQLFAPNPVPGFTTFQEYFEFIKEGDLVTQALDIRMFSGETPTKLLEQMSERGRQRYEVALKAQEDVVQELDRQRAKPTPTPTEYSDSDYQSYLKSEAEYNKTLSNTPPASVHTADVQNNNAVSSWGTDNRKGLPARYTTPIRTYSPNPTILCGSTLHTGADTYAADIQVVAGTEVRATTQGETVSQVVNSYSGTGYGKYVKTYSVQVSAGANRTYYHIYAHLNQTSVNVNDVLDPANLIGYSGSTGTTPPRLICILACPQSLTAPTCRLISPP